MGTVVCCTANSAVCWIWYYADIAKQSHDLTLATCKSLNFFVTIVKTQDVIDRNTQTCCSCNSNVSVSFQRLGFLPRIFTAEMKELKIYWESTERVKENCCIFLHIFVIQDEMVYYTISESLYGPWVYCKQCNKWWRIHYLSPHYAMCTPDHHTHVLPQTVPINSQKLWIV